MERSLGGADYLYSSVRVHIGKGSEGLHRGLIVLKGMVASLYHHVAFLELFINISVLSLSIIYYVSFYLLRKERVCLYVILRMHEHRVVL